MNNLRDFTDSMMGNHKPIVNIDKVIDFCLDKADNNNNNKRITTERLNFYDKMSMFAHMLHFYGFTILFHSFADMEFAFMHNRKDCPYTYTHSINSLIGCAIVDFTRAIQKVYINKDVKKPARLDEMIKYINSNYKNLFENN